MTSNSIGRVGAWLAMLSWPVLIAGFVLENDLVIAVAQVMTVPFFYALILAHRSRSGSLAMVGGYAAILGTVLGGIASGNVEGTLWLVGSVLSGLGVLVFGYLGLSSPVVSKVLAVVGLAFGVLQTISSFVPLPDESIVGPLTVLTGLIWTVWLSVLFLRGRMVEA